MSFRLKETDCETLKGIADCRMLTVTQLAAIFGKSMDVVRRRMHDLEKQGLVEVVSHEYGRGRGRPEKSLGVTRPGVDILRGKGLIDPAVPYEKVVAEAFFGADHQLLLNWCRIHLMQIGRVLPRLSVQFLAANSPCLPQGPDGPVSITCCTPALGRRIQETRFTPDAVFVTCDSVKAKACLFFLEVDCGTETMVSARRDMTDIRQKIIRYQEYFRSQRYKHYEAVFHCSLRGFRLLFLTHSLGRLRALCQLTQEMPPSDFIWLTECSRLFPEGVSAKIWARGGDLQGPPQSILGSLCACQAPARPPWAPAYPLGLPPLMRPRLLARILRSAEIASLVRETPRPSAPCHPVPQAPSPEGAWRPSSAVPERPHRRLTGTGVTADIDDAASGRAPKTAPQEHATIRYIRMFLLMISLP